MSLGWAIGALGGEEDRDVVGRMNSSQVVGIDRDARTRLGNGRAGRPPCKAVEITDFKESNRRS